MSVFSKYRTNVSIDWGIDTTDFPFVKCSEIEKNIETPFYGMFITPDSGYGEGAILILEKSLLSLPQRYVSTIKDMLRDKDVIDAIKAGHAGILVSDFVSKKYKKTGYDVDFVELK